MSTVSIILPTYNGMKYIGRALQSVINQDFNDWELLVIDDGSSDTTVEIVEKYAQIEPRIIYLKNEKNLGIQRTLNKGLQIAKGKYIARIDDDDQWIEKNKLSLQVAYLDEHVDCVLVGTGTIIVNEEGKETTRYIGPQSDTAVRNNILSRNCFVHSSVLFRADAVRNLGGYSESIETKHSEDYDLWLRLGSVGIFTNLPIYGVRFLLSTHNISSQNLLMQYSNNIRLIKKYRNNYPNYYRGLFIAQIRFIGALLFGKIIPPALRGKIIGVYKTILSK